MLLGRTWGTAAKRRLRRRRLECERLESRRVLATAMLNATTLEFQALAGEMNDTEVGIRDPMQLKIIMAVVGLGLVETILRQF